MMTAPVSAGSVGTRSAPSSAATLGPGQGVAGTAAARSPALRELVRLVCDQVRPPGGIHR